MSKKTKEEKTKISIISNETKHFVEYLKALLEEYGFNVQLLKRQAKKFAVLSVLILVVYKVVVEHYELFAFNKIVRYGVYFVSIAIVIYWLSFVLYPFKIIIQNALAYWAFVIGYKAKEEYEEFVMFLCKHIPQAAKSIVIMQALLITYSYTCKFELSHYTDNLPGATFASLFYLGYWGSLIYCCFSKDVFKGWVLNQNQCHKSVHRLWKDWGKKKNLKLIFYCLIPLEIAIAIALSVGIVFI